MRNDALKLDRYDIASCVLAGIALVLVLALHLLPALLAGLLVYELVHVLVARLPLQRFAGTRAKAVAVGLLTVVIVAVLTLAVLGLIAFLRSDAGSLPGLLKKMAEILEHSRAMLPEWLREHLPNDASGVRESSAEWLRNNAAVVQKAGTSVGRALVHILIGMVIGAMLALRETVTESLPGPLAQALVERAKRLGDAFRRVVFAQVRISAINATFTAIYLMVALPLFGVELHQTPVLIAVTFIAGLMPIIGNLISNTVIVIVSLNHSLPVALSSLAFLVIIHKLEYFLNARIVGTQINARAWELLLAMLLLESAFGATGLIAAPIFYAYVKDELAVRGMI